MTATATSPHAPTPQPPADAADPFYVLESGLHRAQVWLAQSLDAIVEANPDHESLAEEVENLHAEVDRMLGDAVCALGSAGANARVSWLAGQIVPVELTPLGTILALAPAPAPGGGGDLADQTIERLVDEAPARLVCPISGCDEHFGDGRALREHLQAAHAATVAMLLEDAGVGNGSQRQEAAR